jgi:cholera toxin transcriptional activator
MASSQPITGPRLVRFGLFEADLRTGELRKSGARIRLQEQPFQVLAALLQAPNEIITREQLRERIWPADTFVDFDHSLNTAVNKLREALGDSAVNSRFVGTVGGRGYRFVAAVRYDSDYADQGSRPAEYSAQSTSGAETHLDLDVPLPPRGLTRSLFVLIQLMYLVFYVAALIHAHRLGNVVIDVLPDWTTAVVVAVVVTAGAGIPLRCYLISAASFDHRQMGDKFQRLFVITFPLDELWALAPFLIVEKIGLGAALAATAGLVYMPFSQRTLIRMAYSFRRSVPQRPGT